MIIVEPYGRILNIDGCAPIFPSGIKALQNRSTQEGK